MKRYFLCSVCFLLIFVLSVPAFAVVDESDYYFTRDDGVTVFDENAYNHAVAVDLVASSDVNITPEEFWLFDGISYTYDFAGFMALYNSLVPAPAVDTGIEENNIFEEVQVNEDMPVFEDENVDSVLPGLLEDTETVVDIPIEKSDSITLYAVSDSGVSSVPSSTGIKSLIESIFGIYEPVKTTAVYTQVVNGEIVNTVYEAVPPGISGVDFTWCAGVLLFAILLYCMMKLLGGVLS